MNAPAPMPLLVELSPAQLDELAERVAARLRAEEDVDQDHLPTGITRRVFLDAARSGAFPTRKVGRKVTCRRADLDAWVRSRPSATSTKIRLAPPATAEEAELREIAKRNRAGVR